MQSEAEASGRMQGVGTGLQVHAWWWAEKNGEKRNT